MRQTFRVTASVIALLLILAMGGLASPGQDGPDLMVATPSCEDGFYRQPGNRMFAVGLFNCNSALGRRIVVLCAQPLGECILPPWRGDHTAWQQEMWAQDVTGFAWDPNGKCLYVSTGETYGTGNLYALNLATRRARAVPFKLKAPPATNRGTTVRWIDREKARLDFLIDYYDWKNQRHWSEPDSIALSCDAR